MVTGKAQTMEQYRKVKAEWTQFEPRILAQIKDGQQTEQLKIRMYRKEYEKVIAILTKGRYPTLGWDGGYEIKANG